MSRLNIHVRWNILPQYCSERAAEILSKSVLSRCVLFLLVEIPTTVAGVLWIFVPHYPELWQLETAAITVTSQLVSVQGDSPPPRNLMSLTTKVSFSVNIYQWMKLYCHCQWNPEVPKVSLSQCLKQSIHRTYQGTLLQIFWQIGVGQCCVGGDICDAYKNALEDKSGPPPHR